MLRLKISKQSIWTSHLGLKKAMRLCFQDTAELKQDSNYIDETAYHNTGLIVYGMCSMWLSMFSRHVKQSFEDDEIEYEAMMLGDWSSPHTSIFFTKRFYG
jgi:hypothetical protein